MDGEGFFSITDHSACRSKRRHSDWDGTWRLFLLEKQIRFDFSSHRYGEILQVAEDSSGHIWLVGSYGVFQWRKDQPEAVTVELIEENIQPLCIAESKQGMWLISTKGISYYRNQELTKHFGLLMD